jgi:diadenylate cyclase
MTEDFKDFKEIIEKERKENKEENDQEDNGNNKESQTVIPAGIFKPRLESSNLSKISLPGSGMSNPTDLEKKTIVIQTKEFSDILKMISFGTPLRSAIEKIAKARTGALIVVGNEDVLKLIKGGFYIDCKFTPNRVAELAKMDGAIILNNKLSRILYAATLLVPDPEIKTTETGSRHQCAERTAKQTNQLVIAVSQRTGNLTVYYGNVRYQLKQLEDLLSRTRATLNNLEKYRKVVDNLVSKLNMLEIMGFTEIHDVTLIIQRMEIVLRIEKEIRRHILELGKEAGFLEMEFKELIKEVEKEYLLIIRDYKNKTSAKRSRKYLSEFSYDSLLDLNNIAKILGYDATGEKISAKGYRLLSKLKSLSPVKIELLLKKFTLREIFDMNAEKLERQGGIDKREAIVIVEEIKKLKNELISKL